MHETTAQAATDEIGRDERTGPGVFSTPSYIVDYVVKHTVGALLRGADAASGHTTGAGGSVSGVGLSESTFPRDNPSARGGHPVPVGPPWRILDPACGCGAFLIGAYRYLLGWHRNWHAANGAEKHPAALARALDGTWRLTAAARKRILLDSIYGVDIDPRAVEATRRSLAAISRQGVNAGDESEDGPLDLSGNIKCGDSLIGPDFYGWTARENGGDGHSSCRVTPFDWQAEFAAAMEDGGFDVIVGNPPYISFYARESLKPARVVEEYLAWKYSAQVGGRLNTFLLFLVQSLRLKSPRGCLAMVVPDTLAHNESYEEVRQALVESGLCSVSLFDFPAFRGATVRTIVPVVGPRNGECAFRKFLSDAQVRQDRPAQELRMPLRSLTRSPRCRWTFEGGACADVLARMERGTVPLGCLAEVRDGVNPGPREFRQRILNPPGPPRPTWRPVIEGRHVTRYRLLPTERVLDYDLALLTPELRRKGASFRKPRLFAGTKLVSRQTADRLIFALDAMGCCTLNSVHNTLARDGRRSTLLFLLGLLNSRLLSFYYRARSQETRRVFPQVHIAALRQLPVPALDLSRPDHCACHSRLQELVERMLALHQRQARPIRIAETDRDIDELVFDLYGLREKDKRVVRQADF